MDKDTTFANSVARGSSDLLLGDPQDGQNRAGFLVHSSVAGTFGDFQESREKL